MALLQHVYTSLQVGDFTAKLLYCPAGGWLHYTISILPCRCLPSLQPVSAYLHVDVPPLWKPCLTQYMVQHYVERCQASQSNEGIWSWAFLPFPAHIVMFSLKSFSKHRRLLFHGFMGFKRAYYTAHCVVSVAEWLAALCALSANLLLASVVVIHRLSSRTEF